MNSKEFSRFIVTHRLTSEPDTFDHMEEVLREENAHRESKCLTEITIRSETYRFTGSENEESGVHHQKAWEAWNAGATVHGEQVPATRP